MKRVPVPDGNAVSQRVVSTSPPPPDNTMFAHAPWRNKGSNTMVQLVQLIEPCGTTDTVIPQNIGSDRPGPKTEWQRLKQKGLPTERVEGVTLMTNWHLGGTVPSDENWKVMGKEWLGQLERAKQGAPIFCGIRTKGKGLEKYKMMGLAPTEPTGPHMWQLRHCSGSFDLLVRKSDPGRKKRKM